MVWWWPEKMAETGNHCKLLIVLLHEGIINKYLDWLEEPLVTPYCYKQISDANNRAVHVKIKHVMREVNVIDR